jgi:hypothetical protein
VYANAALDFVHDPADFRQASLACGIFRGTATPSELFFRLNFLHNKRSPVFSQVILDVFSGVFKTKTDEFVHGLSPSRVVCLRLWLILTGLLMI